MSNKFDHTFGESIIECNPKPKRNRLYDPFGIEARIGELPTVDYALNRGFAQEEARKHGLEIVEGDERTLQLDFDQGADYQQFINIRAPRMIQFLKGNMVQRVWFTESRSSTAENPKKHVYVRLSKAVTDTERVALQATLGSDPTREFLNLMRIVEGSDQPVLFFEVPGAPEIVIYDINYQPQLTDGTVIAGLLEGAKKGTVDLNGDDLFAADIP